jgi:hypothetical protein
MTRASARPVVAGASRHVLTPFVLVQALLSSGDMPKAARLDCRC